MKKLSLWLPILFLTLIGIGCAGKSQQSSSLAVSTDENLVERDLIDLAGLRFEEQQFAKARQEYVRLLLNYPKSNLKEFAQYRIAETYYRQEECDQAERYFELYRLNYPTGNYVDAIETQTMICKRKQQVALEKSKGERRKQAAKRAEAVRRKRLKRKLPKFRTTWYWVENEADYADVDLVPLLTPSEQVIKQVPSKFYKRLLIEGTGRLRDGRIVNWAAKERYIVVDERSPYGLGAGNRSLVPFRTVAVDRKLIPLDTLIYIREYDGLQLPNGATHDGCFVAADVGSAIKKRRIDIFAPTHKDALQVIARVPEHVSLYRGDKKCEGGYQPDRGVTTKSKL